MSVLRPLSGVLSVTQRLLDGVLIAAALFGASASRDLEWTPLMSGAALAAFALFLIFGELLHLYGSWRLRSLDDEFENVFIAWGASCLVLIVGAFMLKLSASYSRLAIAVWFLTTPLLLIGSRLALRFALRWLRKAGRNTRTVGIAGSSSVDAIVRELEGSSSFGLKVAGVFDDRPKGRLAEEGHDTSRHAGSFGDLVEQARHGKLDYVFITLPMRAEKRIVELANRLADTTASVYVVPDLFVFDLMRARSTTVGGLPAVSVYESPFDGLKGWLKRAEDFVLASVFLLAASVPMLVIAIAIKVTTKGPVLFRQRRYGLNGKLVEVLKFRTMTSADDGEHVPQARKADARVTPVGRFLRATSLDELPQLFNVLRGDMSLVGPRPHAVAHNEEYRRLIHGYMLRHKVKPGITGWAQVNGWRGETDTLEKMRHRVDYDLEYLRNWSLALDLKILASTVAAVVSRRNAH